MTKLTRVDKVDKNIQEVIFKIGCFRRKVGYKMSCHLQKIILVWLVGSPCHLQAKGMIHLVVPWRFCIFLSRGHRGPVHDWKSQETLRKSPGPFGQLSSSSSYCLRSRMPYPYHQFNRQWGRAFRLETQIFTSKEKQH